MGVHHSKRQIAYLDPADFLGGAEIFSLETLSYLSEEFAITVITSGQETKYLDGLPKNVKTLTIRLPRLRPFRPFAYLRTIWHLRQICHRHHLSLIHSNSVRAGMFAAFSGRPWVHFAHDFTAPGFFVRLLRNASAVCACSQAVESDLIAKGLAADSITVIPNGIELKKFQNIIHQPFDAERPIIGMIGRIDPWKGQDIFLEAAQTVHQHFPGARFLIFGESSQHDPTTVAFESVLREKVRTGNMEYVEFCGFLPTSEIFSKIHLLVHASTKPEPFGRVALEALAARIPVVAAQAGGIPEILGDELKEFGFPPGNVQELAEKIIHLLKDETIRKRYVKAARLRSDHFKLEKTVSAISRLWNKTIENTI